jgi:DNA polymerase-1
VAGELRARRAPYCKVKLVSFEPGSRDKIANRLTRLFGWTPVDYTPTGKPKVDETTLGGLDYPEAKLLIRYLTVDKRLGQLATGDEAWLKRVRPTAASTAGSTPTARSRAA